MPCCVAIQITQRHGKLVRSEGGGEVHKSLPISSGNIKDAPGKQAGKQSGTNRISTGHRNVSVGHPYTNMFFRLFCEQRGVSIFGSDRAQLTSLCCDSCRVPVRSPCQKAVRFLLDTGPSQVSVVLYLPVRVDV
ncbi:hypothetical protein H9L39_16929 [Fusarium oxysporum f. sp. albedinis]|nr:hypothetical protein H9L39_16929 [Fusarium oxysporum f. sp. albedinis]